MCATYSRWLVAAVVAFSAALVTSPRLDAQTRVGVSGGFARVGASRRLGGVTTAPHVQLGFERTFRRGMTAELLLDAYAMDAMEEIPECAADPGANTVGSLGCDARTIRAGSLIGASLGTRFYPWLAGFAVTAGAGAYYAPSVHGSAVSSTSGALSGGATYEFSHSRFLPVLGFRYVRMLSDPGGVRWIASPEAGIRF